jgi:hypothetical protein
MGSRDICSPALAWANFEKINHFIRLAPGGPLLEKDGVVAEDLLWIL